MVASKILLVAFAAVASAISTHAEDAVFAKLLKRQAPGTPSYNCHDNCGTAITLSRQPNKCDSEAFKTNYNNCLQCAGPDNYNIWRMYGNTLSAAGSSCGLKTEPASGKQPDVGPAVHAGTSSTPVASATPASASSTPAASADVSATPTLSVSGVPSPSSNATSSFTAAPPQQSINAGALLSPACVLGAIVVGAIVGV